jgi:subtilisin family serine protease
MRCAIKACWMVAWFQLCAHASAQDTGQVTDTTIQQLRSLEQAQQERTPAEKKISSNLLGAVTLSQQKAIAASVPSLRPLNQPQPEKKVLLTVKGQITPELQEFLGKEGGTGIRALPEDNLLSVQLPLSQVKELAARPEVNSVDFAARQMRNASSGLQDPEGEVAHDAASARTHYNTTGVGVKVCVMSDSLTYLEKAKDNGSLGEVQVARDASGAMLDGTGLDGVEGEGTAMLEIVHRIAPGATLEFATAYPAETDMAENIDVLRNDGCKIIVDDITYYDESPFQDGPIAKRVNRASDAGILYFSAAANSGNQAHGTSGTWEGDFKPSGTTYTALGKTYVFHEFSPGVVYDIVTNTDNVPGAPQAMLFWDDPLSAASNEYQLAVVDANNNVVSISNTVIDGHVDPYQTLSIQRGERIAILRASDAQTRFLHLATNRAQLRVATSGATLGHNASHAANAFTIASITAAGRPAPFAGGKSVSADSWTSDGPRRIYYAENGTELTPGDLSGTGGSIMQKPDFTAADCVTTDNPSLGLSNFCGTSAAAPHAAAIAALIWSVYPKLTPAQIRGALSQSALRIEGSLGWNDVAGRGIIMPGPALQAAKEMVAQPAENESTGQQ